jgi:hypothetical protein
MQRLVLSLIKFVKKILVPDEFGFGLMGIGRDHHDQQIEKEKISYPH